jgi:hypothetical protein
MCSVQGLKYVTALKAAEPEPADGSGGLAPLASPPKRPDSTKRKLADAPPLGSGKRRGREDEGPPRTSKKAAPGPRVVLFGRHTRGDLRVLANNSAEGGGVEGMSVMLDNVWYLTEAHALEAHKFMSAASASSGARRQALLEYSGIFKGLRPVCGDSMCLAKARGRDFALHGAELYAALGSAVPVQTRICMFKISQSRIVRETLASTGSDTLVLEDSHKGRWSFWGGCVAEGVGVLGANNLGNIWMKLRDAL